MGLQPERPSVKRDAAGDMNLAHLAGRKVSLDEETFECVRDQLLALADGPGESDLFLDFGNVEYLASTVLDTLVSLHQRLRARGRHLTVGNLSPQVYEVFAVTGLDRLLSLRPAGQGDGPPARGGLPRSPAGVLIVDDETAVLCALAAGLRSEGYKVWSAGHGRQAVELYQRHREEIDVALLDVLMPGMDGPHTLTALRKLCPTLPCCFMTGNPGPYTEEGLLRMGAARVFQKPFPLTEMVDTLDRLAGRSPPRRQERWIETPSKGV